MVALVDEGYPPFDEINRFEEPVMQKRLQSVSGIEEADY